jgi:hypothetical protein
MGQLSKLPCMVEVNKVEGPYDIVVKLSDNNIDCSSRVSLALGVGISDASHLLSTIIILIYCYYLLL